jgi:hypothetical protein
MKTNKVDRIKDNKMRVLYTIFFTAFILFSGCDNGSELITTYNDKQLDKPNWISLPDIEGTHIENSFTVTKKINGSQGGFLTTQHSYFGGPFGSVTINAELIIEQGAYPGNKLITITNDDFECVTAFDPEFDNFNRLVTYSIKYTGIDLSGINPNRVKFAYIASNGDLEFAQHQGINIDLSSGTIQVINAIIPHFSRYGFVN